MMHDHEKSDSAIVAVKPTNKAGQPAAELVEPRAGICFQYRSDAIRVQDALHALGWESSASLLSRPRPNSLSLVGSRSDTQANAAENAGRPSTSWA